MENILAEINSVNGVQGSFICGNQGQVLASVMPDSFDPTMLDSIGRQVIQLMVALDKAGGNMNEICFTCNRGSLVARDAGEAMLIVLGEPHTEIALLRLTLNVAAARLRNEKKMKVYLAHHPPKREIRQGEVDETAWRMLATLNSEGADHA